MTGGWRVLPGRPAIPADRGAAARSRRMLAGELARAREAALAWRNGLAGLFVGLLSFGLVKGRAEIGKLAAPYGASVGTALLLSLVCGTYGALLLLRAAHGVPAATRLLPGTASLHASEHLETMGTVRALRRGVILTVTCGALLVTGVAITWYGPAADKPGLLVRTRSGTECGTPLRTQDGVLVLRTGTGEVAVPLTGITGLTPVEACPSPPAG
ncbi:hypothetical protein [Streptomyces sp. NPDC060198]|uniref:hypothetical protein n=1 Tax=Streptomyces sp. NPDC060198 TaxID=3347070 RepID=UPI00365F1205